MSTDETPKIEPILIVKDAPPIAAVDQPPAPEAAKPEIEAATPEIKVETKAEAPVAEATAPDAAKTEAAAPDAAKAEPAKAGAPTFELSTSQAPNLPPAPQLEPVVVAFKKPEAARAPAAPQARSTRFALLAACVAIAASFGAIGGSLGVAKFGPMITSAPAPSAPVAKEQIADEVKALKDTVAQLRATTNKLSDNFAALKITVTTATTQNGKIAETLDRIEKSQAEQRKTAAVQALEAAKAAPGNAQKAADALKAHAEVEDDIQTKVGLFIAGIPWVLSLVSPSSLAMKPFWTPTSAVAWVMFPK